MSVLEIMRSVALLVLLSLRGSHGLPRCYSKKAHFVQHLQGTLGYSGEKGQDCGTPGKYSGGSCSADSVSLSCDWLRLACFCLWRPYRPENLTANASNNLALLASGGS